MKFDHLKKVFLLTIATSMGGVWAAAVDSDSEVFINHKFVEHGAVKAGSRHITLKGVDKMLPLIARGSVVDIAYGGYINVTSGPDVEIGVLRTLKLALEEKGGLPNSTKLRVFVEGKDVMGEGIAETPTEATLTLGGRGLLCNTELAAGDFLQFYAKGGEASFVTDVDGEDKSYDIDAILAILRR